MNILFTVNTYYPLKDGVQSVTGYLAEGLAQKGHDVTVVTPKYNACDEEIHNGVQIIRVNIYTKHAFYLGEKEKYIQLILAVSEKADVMINVCTQNPTTDLLMPVLDSIKCKKILYMHGMHNSRWHMNVLNSLSDIGHKVWNNIRWGLYYKTSGRYFKKYDRVIQLHRFDDAYAFFSDRYGIYSDVIENAAEPAFFEPAEKSSYAIFVANYMNRKNQEFVLKAFYQAHLKKTYGLKLIGSDANAYYEYLCALNDKLTKQYGKKDVEILYGVSRDDTIELIKHASLYLLGSKWEAFPISIVEAMAAGIPYISTDVGIVRYLPGGVVVHKTDEMAYWMEQMCDHRSMAEKLGESGKKYAEEQLSTDVKINQLLELIEIL